MDGTRCAGWALLLAVAMTPSGADGAPAAQMPPAEVSLYRGQPLGEALLSLQRAGLTLVFTSQLVHSEMKVVAEPVAREPRRILDEILAPHGLAVEERAEGVLVVVAAKARGDDRSSAITGEVYALGSRRGPAGALVRVIEHGFSAPVGADGSFSLPALAPGTYTLAASAPGYLEQQVGVSLRPEARRQVSFVLQPEPYVHDEIVVRPSRLSLLLEQPDSTFTLGRDEIDRLPHLGDDFFRAASLLPGVAANDVTAQFSVHGGRRDEVKILFDGQELYGTFHLQDYDNALSVIPARILARAELATGSYPVSQGDRMSGVLDLRTAEPPASGQTVLGLSAFDVLASSAGRFAESPGGWLLAGRQGSLELVRTAVGNEKPRFWDLFGKAELATGPGQVGARLLVADDTLGVDQKEGEETFERLANDYHSTYGWLTHQAAGRRLLVETAGSWARTDTDRRGRGRDEEGSHDLSDQRDLEVLGLSQDWSFAVTPRHLARWGGELRRYDAFFDYARAQDPDMVIAAPFSPPRSPDERFAGALVSDHLGLWASDRASWGNRLTADLGARYDRHTATDDTLLSPRLTVAWKLTETSVVRAAWGRFYQSQRPYELQVADGETTLRQAERSVHQVLGYETLFSPNRLALSALRVELFRRDIDDPRPRYENPLEPLNFFPEIEPDRVRVAPEQSTAQGLEILLRGSPGTRFSWWLAYSYSRARDHFQGEVVPRALDQPHTATLALDHRLSRHWSLSLAWRYHTGWPTTPVEVVALADPEEPDEEPELTPAFGRLNSERLPVYHRLDLRASRSWTRQRGRLTFFVDVQNLYDRKNLAGFDASFDEDEGTLELDKEHWPGIFPSLGVTWEF